MSEEKKQRIILLDILRVFAVVMMIQGHTVHSLLDISYQHSTSFIYQAWLFFRGTTAPIFIFSSGLVFTYLLLQNPLSYNDNSRIQKGIIRGITLILIGYLLRYPTINIFRLEEISSEQWLTYFSIDALHLIGVGLLLILSFSYLGRLLKLDYSLLFLFFGLIILFASPFINSLKWSTALIPIASYFTFEFGSIFPLFPYLLYIFLGGLFGALIANNKFDTRKLVLLIILFGIGVVQILFSIVLSDNFGMNLYYPSFVKIGMVFLLFSTIGLLARNVRSLPNYLQSLARNSLWIYIIHLVLLYGSPTSIGLYQIVGKTQSVEVAVISAFVMLILMTIISLGIDKLRVTKIKIF